MKIVLIRPPDPRGKISILSHTVPVDLGYLAAYLIKNGYTIEIWDYEVEQFSQNSFIKRTATSQPKIISFSCFTPTIISAHKLAKIIKENFPSIHCNYSWWISFQRFAQKNLRGIFLF